MAARESGRGQSVSRRKIECDGTRKSGRDKRSEHLIERQKKGDRVQRVYREGGVQAVDERMDEGRDVE